MFKRIAFTKNSHELFKLNFFYELAPFPVTLFNESTLRKTKKSLMYEVFTTLCDTSILEDTVYVTDGRLLLHRVVWQKRKISSKILNRYIEYIRKNFKESVIVAFDGYPGNLSEKKIRKRLNVLDEWLLIEENLCLTKRCQQCVTKLCFFQRK